jgi:hypothetical protein
VSACRIRSHLCSINARLIQIGYESGLVIPSVCYTLPGRPMQSLVAPVEVIMSH